MSILIQKQYDDCINIYCKNKLGFFDLKKKSRFCRKCRTTTNELRWKCERCDNIISNSQFRETKKFCDDCKRPYTKSTNHKPRFKPHKCKSESSCQVCKNYINKLDDHRQSIIGGDVKSKKLLRLSVTSHSNNTRQGKRKFDLPKPRLARPFFQK